MATNTGPTYVELVVENGRIEEMRSVVETDAEVKRAIDAYSSTIAQLVHDGKPRFAFAYARKGRLGEAGRIVLSPRNHEKRVQEISRKCGVTEPLGVVILDRDFVAGRHKASLEMRDIVSNDLARLVAVSVVIQGTGPVERMIPWLTGVAASVVLYGETPNSDRFTTDTVSRFVKAMAREEFGEVNSMGKLATHHPDYAHIFEAVAEEASRRRLKDAVPIGSIERSSARSVLAALASVGVAVTH